MNFAVIGVLIVVLLIFQVTMDMRGNAFRDAYKEQKARLSEDAKIAILNPLLNYRALSLVAITVIVACVVTLWFKRYDVTFLLIILPLSWGVDFYRFQRVIRERFRIRSGKASLFADQDPEA